MFTPGKPKEQPTSAEPYLSAPVEPPTKEVPPESLGPYPPWMQERLSQFDKICLSSRKVFEERNMAYEDAISATGSIGACVEIVSMAARLKPLAIRTGDGGKANAQKLVEILKDIHNYTNIAIMMLQDKNYLGK